MVFPYMDHDLCGLLTNGDFKMTHSVAKLLMRQILEGMDYIHAVSFCSYVCLTVAVPDTSEQLHPSRH